MKHKLLLLLAPLKVWSRQCVCGQANQPGCASVTYTGAISDAQHGRDEPSQPAGLANGRQTGPQEYPFIAAIVDTFRPTGPFCTGAIIDEHHVLLAAHCVHGMQAAEIGVYVGSNRFNATGAKLATVTAIHAHPQWDPERLVYDLAMLRVRDALGLDGHTAAAVCVLCKPESINKTAVAVAWDSAWDRGRAVSPLLQAAFETHDLASCSARPSGGPQFCAYAVEATDCRDGSDGPLVLWQEPRSRRYFVLGVSSYGQGCRRYPDIVTDVTRLRPWMQSVLQADGGRLCG